MCIHICIHVCLIANNACPGTSGRAGRGHSCSCPAPAPASSDSNGNSNSTVSFIISNRKISN